MRYQRDTSARTMYIAMGLAVAASVVNIVLTVNDMSPFKYLMG